ncbi:MAG: energy transducer TonB [Candidatus Omnitrophica bacterium]|nr:energy transducer TonB [Candidatus Omnitrophota bacterium]MCM8807029.1 energy transducer TonB [Candidatus Omnitrophota bacterium]
MKRKLFLKAIFFSFLLHITGISLFSILLPLPLKKRKMLEVFLYTNEGVKKEYPKKTVLKEIKENLGTEKVESKKVIFPLNISTRDLIGEKEYVSKVDFKIDFEEINFNIVLPDLSEFKENLEEELIEGPAGERKIIYKEKIEYPIWAQKKGMEGKVRIKFWINPDGKIIETEIISSSGFPEIDIYAEGKFRKWIFNTVKSNKNVWGIITFNFKLK